MKKRLFFALPVLVGAFLMQAAGAARPPQAGGTSAQPIRPIGMVTQIQPGQLILHTDSGADLMVHLPDGVRVLRVPPGAKDLKSATTIAVTDVSIGDRVLILGPVSADQKSVVAKSVIVMTKTALEQAHESERLAWQQSGIGGVVKTVDPTTREIILAVPNAPPTPGNPTHPVTVTLGPNAELLRYASDSIKFSDAKPGTFGDIKVGDQLRALGSKGADDTRYTAEKLVSGTFHNIGATVISVDAAHSTVTVKNLATGTPLVVRTNADSQLHQLPPDIAYMIARFNAGPGARNGTPGGSEGGARGEANGSRRKMGGSAGGFGGPAAPPRDFQQMLESTPPLSLSELKSGEPVIIVSTEGANPSQVTAIALLSGVQPILEARPKGSGEVDLGPWNMSSGGGGGDEGP